MHTIPDTHVDAKLISDLRAREEEFMHYQMNIDYYTAGVKLAKDDEARADMEKRLRDEKAQQDKVKLYLDCIEDCLKGKDISALLIKYPVRES